eukprot:2735734-Ditylum_brightwellii.AAC.1
METKVTLGLRNKLGGMFFSDDGNDLFIVDQSEEEGAAINHIPLTRDSTTNKITGLCGISEHIYDLEYLDPMIKVHSSSSSTNDNIWLSPTSQELFIVKYNETTKTFTTKQEVDLSVFPSWDTIIVKLTLILQMTVGLIFLHMA